jgi:hypothetical protein
MSVHLVRCVNPSLAAQITHTNLSVTATHLRRLAEAEIDDPDRRHDLRDAVVAIDQLRRNLDRIL